MASNYTENYGLCQWEATDQVLRTEFNEDHAKIDAVLSKKLGAVQIIKTIVPPLAVKFEVDLSNIDWSQWSVIGMTLDAQDFGSEERTSTYCQVIPTTSTGVTEYCSSEFHGYMAMFTFMPTTVALLPLRDPTRRIHCLYLGERSGTGFAECSFQELSAIRIGNFNNRFFQTSNTLTIWGMP